MTTQNDLKNVIFIIIDTLRYDHVGFGGYRPSPSPTIDHLMSSGLCATQGFATGCPTSMALPGIFTSTLPLDHGGYDLGIIKRKDSIVEIFKQAGYNTIGFYPGIETDGYERSFDLFFRTVFPSFASSSLNYHVGPVVENYIKENKSISYCIRMIEPAMAACFQDIKTYCTDKATETMGKKIIASPFMHNCGFDYSKIFDLICDEEIRFLSDPSKYIRKFVRTRAFNAILKKLFKIEIRKNSTLLDKLLIFENDIKEKNHHKAEESSNLFQKGTKNFRFEQLVSNIASAGYIMQNLYEWINRRHKNPFFAYVHLFDVHPPCNFISYDLQHDQMVIDREMNAIESFYNEIGSKSNGFIQKDIRYVFGIKYVDEKIKELMTFLESRNIIDNTIIVITSDHGTNYPGVPIRKGVHVIKSFYDEFYRIPILFFNRDIKPRRFDSLCSSMDIAPTLLDIVGLKMPSSFRGKSFAGESTGRDYVIMEHMGAGLCDIDSKPVIISLRTKTHKLVYEAFVTGNDKRQKGVVKQFYNIQIDPLESHNLSNKIIGSSLSTTAAALISIAEARIKEIKKEVG